MKTLWTEPPEPEPEPEPLIFYVVYEGLTTGKLYVCCQPGGPNRRPRARDLSHYLSWPSAAEAQAYADRHNGGGGRRYHYVLNQHELEKAYV